MRVEIDFPEAIDQPTELTPGPGIGSRVSSTGGGIESGIQKLVNTTPTVPQKENRKNSRLRSYVYENNEISTVKQDPSVVEKRNAVSNIGITRVMEFELEQGRTPKDMETVQTHHPGYDIESRSKDGVIRYIEVKALSGIWDSQNPAEMTRTEFETSKKKGEDYWLYIVEHAESEYFNILLIQNPANLSFT